MLISREEKDGYIFDTYSNGTVVKNIKSEPIEPAPAPEPEPTENEIIQGEMLLNQVQIIATQQEQDEVLAAILLNQMEV